MFQSKSIPSSLVICCRLLFFIFIFVYFYPASSIPPARLLLLIQIICLPRIDLVILLHNLVNALFFIIIAFGNLVFGCRISFLKYYFSPRAYSSASNSASRLPFSKPGVEICILHGSSSVYDDFILFVADCFHQKYIFFFFSFLVFNPTYVLLCE